MPLQVTFIASEAPDLSAFADAQYPLTVVAENHMPRDVVFPEVDGLHLRHVASASGTHATVQIASFDQLARLASSIDQIARLNSYTRGVTLTQSSDDVTPPAPPKGRGGRPPRQVEPPAPVSEPTATD